MCAILADLMTFVNVHKKHMDHISCTKFTLTVGLDFQLYIHITSLRWRVVFIIYVLNILINFIYPWLRTMSFIGSEVGWMMLKDFFKCTHIWQFTRKLLKDHNFRVNLKEVYLSYQCICWPTGCSVTLDAPWIIN